MTNKIRTVILGNAMGVSVLAGEMITALNIMSTVMIPPLSASLRIFF